VPEFAPLLTIALVSCAFSLACVLASAFCVLLMRTSGPVVAKAEAVDARRELAALAGEWDARQIQFENLLNAIEASRKQAETERRRANTKMQRLEQREAEQHEQPNGGDIEAFANSHFPW
jgi:uncharacterized protein with von Willebrand factor type A (vWA) domain